jgi:hypothetical protein
MLKRYRRPAAGDWGMEAVTAKTSVQMDIHPIVYHKIYGLSSMQNGFLQFVYFLEGNLCLKPKKKGISREVWEKT